MVTGQTFARVSYDIPGQQQRFARVRGLRDAENRAAKVIADNISIAAGVLFRRRDVVHGFARRDPMVALESRATGRSPFVARPDPARPIVLVYGPDAGLVRERAEAIISASVETRAIRSRWRASTATTLAAEPSRLVEEANTVPLFGGRRAVWVKAGSRNFAPRSRR